MPTTDQQMEGKFVASSTGFVSSGDESGAIFLPPTLHHLTVQGVGDFTGGLALEIEGSNDGGTTWAALNDSPGGSAIQISAAGIHRVDQLPDLIRVRASAGSGGGDADVHFIGYTQ